MENRRRQDAVREFAEGLKAMTEEAFDIDSDSDAFDAIPRSYIDAALADWGKK